MTKKISSIRDAHASLNRLSQQKYNAGLWIESVATSTSEFAEGLRDTQGVVLLDVLDNLLPALAKDATRQLGVFDVNDLTSWLEEQSASIASEQGAICTEIDALLATLSGPGARDFFKLAQRLVLRRPIVLVTKLKALVLASQFPDDRIWELEMGDAQ